MSERELESLVKMMRHHGPAPLASPQQLREGLETMLSHIPIADEVVFEPSNLDGLPALWSITPGVSRERALLYLHGGGYLTGSASGYRPLFSRLASAAGVRGLAIDYRLAPENPYPAAVEDAVKAYRALLDQGIEPENIAVAGDSAGGGLAVAMLVALRGGGLPMPAALAVFSPWVDLELTGRSLSTKAAEDPMVTCEQLRFMVVNYLKDASPRSVLASPFLADLEGLPPLLIQVGSAEILLDDSTRLASRAGEAGVAVRLEIWPRMPHVWHLFAPVLSEARDAINAAGKFIAEQFDAARSRKSADV